MWLGCGLLFGTEIDTSCVTALLYRERFPPGRYLFRVFLEEVMTLNDGDVVNHWFYLVKVSLYSVLLEMFCNDLVKSVSVLGSRVSGFESSG